MKKLRKRLRKKLHRKYISEVVLEFSISDFYREKIFGLKKGEMIILNKNTVKNNINCEITSIFNKFNLIYKVECEYIENNYNAFFIFKSFEFPNIMNESHNWV